MKKLTPHGGEKNRKTKSNKTIPPRSVDGVDDVLPKDGGLWKEIWRVGHSISELHNFHFIETPILERASLFALTSRGSHDDLQKNLFAFGRGSHRLALRSECMLPVIRSYVEHHLGYFASPLKVFCYGTVFLHKKSREEKKNSSHEWGFLIIGDGDPVYDIEVLTAALDFLKTLKFKRFVLKINSNGCRVCRGAYRERLRDFYQNRKSDICAECLRSVEKNPHYLLNCKKEKCSEIRVLAPIILNYLCQGCNNHLKSFLELIEDNGILYEPDPYLLENTEVCSKIVYNIESQGGVKLVVGGRFDYLAEAVNGRQMPVIGATIFIEKLIEAMRAEGMSIHGRQKGKVFFVAVGDQAKKISPRLMGLLRSSGIIVFEALGKHSLGAQFKAAGKAKVQTLLLLGQKEVFEETIILRDMKTGAQETVVLNKMVEEVKKRLK